MPDLLRARIEASGPLNFEQFMALALYHEKFGYYSDPARRRVGGSGDFVTNISIGETFGRLLAWRLHQLWATNGSPPTFHVLEAGPEEGNLALDILAEARQIDPAFHAAIHYSACEHSAPKRPILEARFAESDEPRLAVIATPDQCRAAFGAVIANEVLDALPVRLLRFTGGAWVEPHVTWEQDRLAWTDLPITDQALRSEASLLGTGFSDGYQTELCLGLAPFFESLAACLDRGILTFFDYGFLHHEYYHPDRHTGTLRTYAGHQAGEDPLAAPGRQDLTAHVDFTRAAEAGSAAGLTPLAFGRQESYLVPLAAALLDSPGGGPPSESFIRQLRSLTHPALFGARFHVLEFAKGEINPGNFLPSSLQDLGQLSRPG